MTVQQLALVTNDNNYIILDANETEIFAAIDSGHAEKFRHNNYSIYEIVSVDCIDAHTMVISVDRKEVNQ
jgi:hypothetical protein